MTNILDEINDLKNEANHRAAFRIHALLENNRTWFLKNIDNDFYHFILKQFEGLAGSSTITPPSFKDEYKRLHGMLTYHLDKII